MVRLILEIIIIGGFGTKTKASIRIVVLVQQVGTVETALHHRLSTVLGGLVVLILESLHKVVRVRKVRREIKETKDRKETKVNPLE